MLDQWIALLRANHLNASMRRQIDSISSADAHKSKWSIQHEHVQTVTQCHLVGISLTARLSTTQTDLFTSM